MTPSDLSKALWDLSNAITAFAAVQGVFLAYACAKKETGDILNKKRLKLAIAIIVVLMASAQCVAIEWCRRNLCAIDTPHCQLQSEAAAGRMLCIGCLAIFSIIILYARQLFAKKPFDP